MIALQGPQAEAVLAELTPDVTEMSFMDVRELHVLGADCVISRSGYTGEDGFELSVPAGALEPVVAALADDDRVEPIGLGARDSLRLEAGLCLYGHDIDSGTTPVEAGLTWAIQRVRRTGGDRAGGFPGAEAILAQLRDGAPRKRVGLLPEGRAPMREGTEIFCRRDRRFAHREDYIRRVRTERRRTGLHGLCGNRACQHRNAALRRDARQALSGEGGENAVHGQHIQTKLIKTNGRENR